MIPEFNFFLERFNAYVNSTGKHDDFVQEHLDLKVQHTFRVVNNIRKISVESGLSEEQIKLAELIALVHDIGRFEQFIKYQTFDDRVSVNHAELGIQIMDKIQLLKELAESDRKIIYGAVINHNVQKLNPSHDNQILHYARLIRDADKTDIWYILTLRDVVNVILEKSNEPDSYKVPQYISDSFRKGEIVPDAVTMNDYRLLRLSWIYDMNFPATFSLILRRGYLPQILAKIPDSSEKQEIADIIGNYMNSRAVMHYDASHLSI